VDRDEQMNARGFWETVLRADAVIGDRPARWIMV
jgi:hypothetical protein